MKQYGARPFIDNVIGTQCFFKEAINSQISENIYAASLKYTITQEAVGLQFARN